MKRSLDQDTPVVQLKKIYKTFDQSQNTLRVLSDVELDVYPNSIISIIGNSGSGKSTLLHILGMLDKPSSGQVIFKGLDCTKMNDEELTAIRRREIGFIYQYHHLLPEFTALENLNIIQMINNKTQNDSLELLEKFNMKSKANQYPGEMSGGENQRVAIARAMINRPSLLLADEPTGNLDQENADIVFSLLLENVRQNNLAAVIVTHNMELAKKTDMVLMLENGLLRTI